jgi:hypothetical protein
VIFLVPLFILHWGSGIGQSISEWSQPLRITNSGGFARTPFVVADLTGDLHVVWSESVVEPGDFLAVDTIYYARRHNDTWSPPVDIMAVSGSPLIVAERLRIDPLGVLHLLVNDHGTVIYATASINDTSSAKSWRQIVIPESAYTADFTLGPDGVIHLAYAIDRGGVYYINSKDGGNIWSVPAAIWVVANGEASSGNVRIEQDLNGVLHVAWGMSSEATQWNPVGIGYSRSIDLGHTWQQTLEVLEGDNFPSIGFDDMGNLHLVWNNPAGTQVGRGHAWSEDGGETWTKVERIFPGLRGLTYWPALAQDSGGTLHLISAADASESMPQLHYSTWNRDHWNDPVVISGDKLGGEGPSLAIALGNKMEVLWFTYYEDEFGIWHTSATSNADPVQPASYSNTNPVTATVTPRPSDEVSTGQEDNTSIPASRPLWRAERVQLLPQSAPIIIPAIATFLLVGLVITIVISKKRLR